MCFASPASASSAALSITSWMTCSGLSVRVYMPGRARTGSRPFRTLMDCSSYFIGATWSGERNSTSALARPPAHGAMFGGLRAPGSPFMQEAMTIGRLAKLAGVNVETVRYYQRRGLLREPSKPAGGQRRYAPAVAQQIGFIRRAQQLGFSLEEVKSLMDLAHALDSGE